MNEKLLSKYHFFLSWQDEAQEKWLEGMSRQGLHLKKAAGLGKFIFEKGASADYSYCLDFNKDKQVEVYLEFIQDTGWEYLGKRGGWYYWRKQAAGGQTPKLFTDSDSKIKKYQRLLTFYATSSPGAAAMYIIGAAMFKRHPGLHPEWFIVLYLGLLLGWLLVAGVNAAMILVRINQLKGGRV